MVKITEVLSGSYAHKKGIAPGDVLIAINGNEIKATDFLEIFYDIFVK